jgi:Ankyrin repeats (3 copies)
MAVRRFSLLASTTSSSRSRRSFRALFCLLAGISQLSNFRQAQLHHNRDADLGHQDSWGNSLLHAAVLRGGAALQAVLPSYAAAGLVDIPSGVPHPSMPNNATASTPLMIACRHAKHAEVKLLLAAGASRYTRDSKGEDALHHAIVGTSLLCCRLILGTAPNWHYTPQQLSETNAAGRNALFAAVQAGLTEVCKLLIAAGMDRGNVHPSGSPSVYMFCDPEDRSIIGGFRSSLVRSFHELALHYWPRRLGKRPQKPLRQRHLVFPNARTTEDWAQQLHSSPERGKASPGDWMATAGPPTPLSPASPLSPPVRTNSVNDAGDVAKRMLSFDLNKGAFPATRLCLRAPRGERPDHPPPSTFGLLDTDARVCTSHAVRAVQVCPGRHSRVKAPGSPFS